MTDHTVLTINAFDGYPIKCRYWPADSPRALIILLHGVVSHSAWLASISDGLAVNDISCLAADRRGAGLNFAMRGDAPDGATLLSDLSAILVWAHSTGLPCHLCGFCWGANYIVNYMASDECSKHGFDIRTISLLAPSIFPSARITDQPFDTGNSSVPDQKPVMPIECFTDGPAFETFIKPDPLRLTRVSTRLNLIMAEFSHGVWIKFLKLKSPTLVVLGSDDEVVDNQATERLFGRLNCHPKALRILAGKHGLQFDVPNEVIRLVHGWVLNPSS